MMTIRRSTFRPSRSCLLTLAALAVAAPLTGHAAYTVDGNRISWTDDGWYQVQNPGASNWNVCNSSDDPGRSCTVPDGTYTVINHTTGDRYANVAVPQGGSSSGFSVSGNTISWGSDGWYQVQRPSTSDYNLCNSSANPSDSCTVVDGTYTVINHTSGERTANVSVPQNGGSGGTGGSGGGSTGATGSGGSQTSSVGQQPNGDMSRALAETLDTWDFQQGGSAPLVSNFFGAFNPGSGIVTRAHSTSDDSRWTGQARVNTGTPGENFWIDFKSTGARVASNHAEFDISVGRDKTSGSGQGYGQIRYRDIPASRDISLTTTAQWMASANNDNSSTPVGKTHVQTIIWIARYAGADSNAGTSDDACVTPQTIDITVADYMDEDQRDPYFNLAANNGGSTVGLPDRTSFVKTVTSSGKTYRVFKRKPGDYCEVASYLAINTTNLFGTSPVTTTTDPRDFIDLAIAEGDAESSWFISNLGWEIASAGQDPAIPELGNSAGKFVFSCYSIPSLNSGSASGAGYERCD